jgi:hypothetical protein
VRFAALNFLPPTPTLSSGQGAAIWNELLSECSTQKRTSIRELTEFIATERDTENLAKLVAEVDKLLDEPQLGPLPNSVHF